MSRRSAPLAAPPAASLVARLVAGCVLLGAAPATAGVIIGNPPQVVWSVASDDTTTRSLTGEVVEIDLYGCDGGVMTVPTDELVDLVDGWAPLLPRGEWCAVTVHLAAPLLRCDDDACSLAAPDELDLEATADVTVRGVIIGNPPGSAPTR